MSAGPVIIGGGPAGLTAAYELSKYGCGSTVLESDDQVGGLSRTVFYEGFRFDIGGHRFFSKVPLVNETWHEILGDEFLLRSRISRIFYDGKFFDYPLKPANALLNLGPVEAVRVALSYARSHLAPERDERSFEAWVKNRFGSRLYEIFFKTYTEKVWGMPCSEISADWAAQRIKNLSLLEAVRAAWLGSGKTGDGEVITTLIEQFHYPRLGPGMMWDRCAEILGERGVPTLREHRVERIRHENGRVVAVVARDPSGAQIELPASHCISSMPVRELIMALDPAPPDSVLQAAHALRYRDYLTTVLILRQAETFPDNWIYIHSPEVKLGRIQNYKNWSPEMVPDPSKTALGLEYFLWEHDEEWDWPNERLIEFGMRECQRIGLVEARDVEDGTVVRMRKAYPIYDHAYLDHLGTIRRFLQGVENLELIGRNGQHRYNNQDHSMLTGIYAARNLILGADYDVWSVNVEAEYHEDGTHQTVAAATPERAVPRPVTSPQDRVAAALDAEIVRALAPLDALALGVAFAAVAGSGLWLATAILLLRGGEIVGPTLGLLGQFLPGYTVTWSGSVIGAIQSGMLGFAVGYTMAGVRNLAMRIYLAWLRRRARARAAGEVLDKV